MGSSYTTMKNLSNEYRDFPAGCVPCPKGNKPGNPGTFEELHKKFDNLELQNFEGFKIIVKKVLSNHFYVSHTLAMSSKCSNQFKDEDKDGYKFGVSYVGIKKVGYKEKYPILYGVIMPNGNLTANFIHTLGCRFRIKFSTQIEQNIYKNSKASAEHRSDDYTLTVTLVNPVLLKQKGLLLVQYLQAITSRITLGCEIACNKTSNLPGEQQTNLAGAFRYSTGFRTLSATFGQAGVRICYHHKQSHEIQAGVEFQSNFITHESKGRFIYQIDVPLADVIFKGFVDTNWRIGAIFKKKLYPIPEASLILSAILNHNKHNVIVGIGLNIE